MENTIEIPFGVKDSELKGWEYTIPEGMEAVIEDGKVIVREKVSEEERMWDKILNHFDWSFKGPYLTHEECDEIKAFLIKQKDQKPVSVVRIPKFRVGDIIQHTPLEKWDRSAKVRAIDENGYSIDYTHIGDTASGGYIGFSFEDEYELVEQKPAEKQDYSGLNDLERAIHRGFLCAGVENVSVVLIKETAQDCLAQIEQKPVYEDEYQKMLADSYKCGKNEVIDNPEKYGLQKPAEWSEEDERILKGIIDEIEANKNNAPDYDIPTYNRFLSWLKSLRPHWKPSEEQMQALDVALENVCHQNDWAALDSLRTALQKLL